MTPREIVHNTLSRHLIDGELLPESTVATRVNKFSDVLGDERRFQFIWKHRTGVTARLVLHFFDSVVVNARFGEDEIFTATDALFVARFYNQIAQLAYHIEDNLKPIEGVSE